MLWKLKQLFCRHKWVFCMGWDDSFRDGKRCEIKIESCGKCHKHKLKQTIKEQKD